MKIKPIRLGAVTLPSNVLMAPLAGYTCYPFRMLCYSLGAGLCFMEMASCNSLKYANKATQKLLYTTPEEPLKAAQLLGANPYLMEYMARSEALADCDILDINMGCPVPNVFKSGEGSALLEEPKKAAAIIRGVKRSGKPVTVKCRVGIREDCLMAAEFAKVCEDAGADLITIHGRSRSMMYDGAPYCDQIQQAKSAVKIPVIANGGIWSAEDADSMMGKTGADGVMIARYALENPFVFSEITGRGVVEDYHQMLLDQLKLAADHYDETFTLTYIKKLASYCMKKRRGVKQYKLRLHGCGCLEELQEVLDIIFGRGENSNG